MTTILAIDAATVKSGWSLIEVGGKQIKLIDFGLITCKGSVPARLLQLRNKVIELIKERSPDHVTVEDLKFSKYARNIASMTKVAYAIGNVQTAFVEAGHEDFHSIPANSVRKVWEVKQNKAALRKAVNSKFLKQLQDKGRPDGFLTKDEDITDSIALGVAVWAKCISNE